MDSTARGNRERCSRHAAASTSLGLPQAPSLSAFERGGKFGTDRSGAELSKDREETAHPRRVAVVGRAGG